MEKSEIIKQLIGNVYPIGDEATDIERLENLKEMIAITHELICNIKIVYKANKDSPYASRLMAAIYAAEFLKGYNLINEEE